MEGTRPGALLPGSLRSYPYVLEEPRSHHVGGVLRQNAPFILRGAVILMQDAQILV